MIELETENFCFHILYERGGSSPSLLALGEQVAQLVRADIVAENRNWSVARMVRGWIANP